MIEFKITVINNKNGDVVDEFVGEFEDRDELTRFMKVQTHNYDIPCTELCYEYEECEY